ncbi:Glutathione synthetase [Massospora cicadina]|nr:Glutathione synthetase [Massospora cicadina]
MASLEDQRYEPAVVEDVLVELSQLYALSNGLLVLPPADVTNATSLLSTQQRPNVGGYTLATPAPTTLYPTPFPRRLFEQAYDLQPKFNELIDKLAADPEFLMATLKPISGVDGFLARLLEIFEATVLQPEASQPIRLGIHRSDYLLHYSGDAGVAAGQNSGRSPNSTHATKSNSCSLVVWRARLVDHRVAQVTPLQILTSGSLGPGRGFRGAVPIWRHFGPRKPCAVERCQGARRRASPLWLGAAILFVVQDGERNVFDQRHIELELFKGYGIPVLRKTLLQISREACLGNKHKLYIGAQEISVVYFRAGYTPADYPTPKEWEARLLLERSFAVKCPNIAYHLAGSKKVQQVLAQPGVLERFVFDEAQLRQMRQTFAGLYPLDPSPEGDAAAARALQAPTNFVMKPSREGGGNNLYGPGIMAYLQTVPKLDPARSAYILMDRILPPRIPNNNVGLRFGQPSLRGDFVSELGIYGIFLARGDDVGINVAGGHLLRTKLDSSDEGGVAVGHSVIDSPIWFDNPKITSVSYPSLEFIFHIIKLQPSVASLVSCRHATLS